VLSRNQRRRVPGREGRLITNTWGDRNLMCTCPTVAEMAART